MTRREAILYIGAGTVGANLGMAEAQPPPPKPPQAPPARPKPVVPPFTPLGPAGQGDTGSLYRIGDGLVYMVRYGLQWKRVLAPQQAPVEAAIARYLSYRKNPATPPATILADLNVMVPVVGSVLSGC